jgi:phospholipase/carboxylesterase
VPDLGFIHRYIPASGKSSRLLLLLHGTGGDENDMLALGRSLDPDAALLSPRGKVLENGQARFFRRFAEGVFDEADVVNRAHELADFINAAAEQYEFEPQRLTAVGYSNGANAAAAVLLLRPDALANAILLRAMVVLSEPPDPQLRGHAVFLSVGEFDSIVPAADGQRLAEILRVRGADVTVETQRAGHNLVPNDFAAARRWLSSL